VFFTGSGSEAADTSLKMARAYWRTKGQGTKTRLIGREKGYHGVNFGGISVGGMVATASCLARASRPTTCPTPSRPQARFPQGHAGPRASRAGRRTAEVIALHDARTSPP
jgi:beta-alanine--pyruvate transaminase